jgi:hypothetical protein
MMTTVVRLDWDCRSLVLARGPRPDPHTASGRALRDAFGRPKHQDPAHVEEDVILPRPLALFGPSSRTGLARLNTEIG